VEKTQARQSHRARGIAMILNVADEGDFLKGIVLIPARFASSRFPGKPLALIKGKDGVKSMIQRVYEGLAKSPLLDVYVVTDDQRIEDHLKTFKGKCLRVDDEVSTGSERIALALERNFKVSKDQIVINVQGDEPLIEAKDIEKIFLEHQKNCWEIGTLYRESNDHSEGSNPNRVKVVGTDTDKGFRAHYFSRAGIPFFREASMQMFKLHVGVYSYRADVLSRFNKLSPTELENAEKLEQLRALDHGISIHLIETKSTYIGVDSPEDLKIVEGVLNGKA
jgi:3-deoxy-manno-octulosonate cytidylyltransferase (CMP-KDO synthetase)